MIRWIAAWGVWLFIFHGAGAPPENFYNAANRFFAEGKFLASETLYRRAFSSSRLGAWARYNAGNAAFKQAQWRRAVEYYEAALRLAPSDEDAEYNLNLARRHLEKKTLAAPARSARLDPKGPPESAAPGDLFSLPPDDVADYIRELTQAGYPFKPGSSLKKPVETQSDEIDW